MNHHLNIFRFYNESNEKIFIENNLSRAFALCLMNDTLFFNEYLRAIIEPEDFDYLFTLIDSDTKYSIDIQIDTESIDKESFKKVYALAMTTDKNLDMSDFFSQAQFKEKKNITDIVISIKDIIVIIEVKRTTEDCKVQLYNQILPFIEKKDIIVLPKSFSWQNVVAILEKINHLQILNNQKSTFINDFLELSKIRFPEWFEAKPFNTLSFAYQHHSSNYRELTKRMSQILVDSGNELLSYDRLGISVPFRWASEIIPYFQYYPNDPIKEYVVFHIWPGNTKQQGYHIYGQSLNWQNKKTLNINGKEYDLEIEFALKLCHFNRYVAGINFGEEHIVKPINTLNNFKFNSGKWNRDQWNDFEKFMDDHFKSDFNWRGYCDWDNNFVNTDRSYFTLAIGYEVCLYIPYAEFQALDKTNYQTEAVSDFVKKIVESFSNLLI